MKSKTLVRISYLSGIYAAVIVLALFLAFSADVTPEKRESMVLGSLFFASVFGLFVIFLAHSFQSGVPNGLPRPESELKRGIPCHVHAVVPLGSRVSGPIGVLANYTGNHEGTSIVIWSFARMDTVEAFKPGSCFVYLDDPDQYLHKWHNNGVVMILSEERRQELKEPVSKMSPSTV